MKLAVFLQHYFPYGGLQRDAIRLTEAATEAGHDATLVVSTWEGAKPHSTSIRQIDSGGRSNHGKATRFADACGAIIESREYDTSIGFSRVPGAPFHFCGDACIAERFVHSGRPSWAKLLPRYHSQLRNERAIFGANSRSHIFFLALKEIADYQRHYQLNETRFTLLPPWLRKPDTFTETRDDVRSRLRKEIGVEDSAKVLLFVGSNYRLKRLDRIVDSLALLDDSVHLAVCGTDNFAPIQRQAETLEVAPRVHPLGARNDLPAWMQAADLLVHPSERETAGMVLTEALTYGLPVTCTTCCGYAPYVAEAGGTLMSNRCPPEELADTARKMLGNLPHLREQALLWSTEPTRYKTAEIILERMQL
ncbi:MAG: glycosyltransferase [Verrucomicrobiaceae bacterium]|nr:glycosyltransferase [Verrucomicrobiaceae bacterium]